ncbi:hypothetical protein D3C71_1132730 [compost metagenome]
MPVARIHVRRADTHEQADHEDLDRNDDRIDEGGLGHAHIEQAGHRGHDQHRRQVEQLAGGGKLVPVPGDRGGTERIREGHVQRGRDETDQVRRPAHRDRGRGEQVLQHQAPADEPGHAFAQGGVGVGVGAAGDRHHRRELGVAQARQCTGNAGEHEREHHCGAGMVGRGLAGEHEDTCADHRTDAQHDEVFGRESPFQRGFAVQAAFDGLAGIDVPGRFDRFDPQQRLQHAVLP